MARVAFGIEKALRIFAENSQTSYIDILFGSGAPGGDTGEQDDAPIGSLYVRTNGSLYQKIADDNDTGDWELNQAGAGGGGTLSGGYTPANGNPAAGDTYEEAFEKIDGNVDDLNTLTGVAQGGVDLGTFTGATIPDSSTIKAALQSLETSLEEIDVNVNDLITLSGVAENSSSLGTFTGAIIQDSRNNKQALQDLETYLETAIAKISATGITTEATVDSVLVDSYAAVKWLVQVYEEATPANKRYREVFAGHNGTASADATSVDSTIYANLNLGSAFNLTLLVDLNGTGGSQVMRLRAASTSAGVTVKVTRIPVVA